MTLSQIGRSAVTTLGAGETVRSAAAAMVEHEVGSIVVVQDGKPVGILTDRDIVVRVIDKQLDPAATPLESVMTKDLLTVEDMVEPLDAAARMRSRQVRRIPIVDAEGNLVGMVTFDDLIHHFGRGLDALADVIGHFPVPHFGG